MFLNFKEAVQNQFKLMSSEDYMFVTDVEKEALWEMYLKSFPEGTNPMFRERTEHDCQCCRSFIRQYGNIIVTKGETMESIWSHIDTGTFYDEVARVMDEFVKSKPIRNRFVNFTALLGTDKSHEDFEGEMITWEHFYLDLDEKFVVKGEDIGTKLSDYQSTKEVFQRGLETISMDAVDTVLDLITQSSVYRGEEYLHQVEKFKICLSNAHFICEDLKDLFYWCKSSELGPAARIRNTVIGTLLVDLSEGMSLDKAVHRFEHKMDPTRFKHPRTVYSHKMILAAESKLNELGLQDSISRRYAVDDDLTINNVIYADRRVKKSMGVFDDLHKEVPVNIKNLDKVEEINIEDFLKKIVPNATSIEMMLENKHEGNLVSLIAPRVKDSPSMFKWRSSFSWAYNGDLTDSIKQKVKAAGGKTDAVLRCSLSWFNGDDLDIHAKVFNSHIFYGNKRSGAGSLDVDMNANGPSNTTDPVENIVWTKVLEGVQYKIWVNQYTRRSGDNIGFDFELEYNGEIYSYSSNKPLRGGQDEQVVTFSFSNGRIKFDKPMTSPLRSKEIWGCHTGGFQKVSMIMNSPNHWDGEETGNKHYMFMLEGCKNPGDSRGFFNEFLRNDLMSEKRVFEALGSKMSATYSNSQLSGIGFSSTKRASVLCKVEGSFNRVIKVKF